MSLQALAREIVLCSGAARALQLGTYTAADDDDDDDDDDDGNDKST